MKLAILLMFKALCFLSQEWGCNRLDFFLIESSRSGDIESVKFLLESETDLPTKDRALQDALFNGHLAIAELLLENGADPNFQDGSALVGACHSGHTAIIKLLLENGVNPNSQNGWALFLASDAGHAEIVKLLLKHGADPNTQNGEALIRAYARGYTEIVQLLWEHGADPNLPTSAAFLRVWGYDDVEALPLLLENGDANIQNDAAFLRAYEDGRIGAVALLVEASPYCNPPGQPTLIALKHIFHNDFDSFINLIESAKIDLSENRILLGIILLSGNYEFVKYVFETVPSLQDAYLVGLSNYGFIYTRGTRAILQEYSKKIENSYIVQLTLPIVLDEAIISHFSGLINPGAVDTYPKHENPFILTDMDQELMEAHEKLYQKVVEAAQKYDIPYLGICAGAQHLVLGATGSLIGKGHKSAEENVEIRLLSGSVPHYLFLTEEERAHALVNCELPEVIIDNAFMAHSYSAVPEMLGEGIRLGAISSKGIPEAFSLGVNKIGVQFHPERYHPDHIEYFNMQYLDKVNIPELNRQKIFLENVFEMFEGYCKSMQYAKRTGLDRLEAKAAIAYANEKLVETLQSCQATKSTQAQEVVWAGVGTVDTPPAQHLYILPGITREDFAYTQDQSDLILYSTAKNGVLSARDFFASNSTKSIYIHFPDGSVFYLQSDDSTAFLEGKSRWIE